jgi:hypothetical protein
MQRSLEFRPRQAGTVTKQTICSSPALNAQTLSDILGQMNTTPVIVEDRANGVDTQERTASSPLPSFAPKEAIALAATLIIAAWLRFHLLGVKSFWMDEGFSLGIARLSWLDFYRIFWHREANMALYYLVLRGWIHLGTTEAMVRGLSAVTSLGAVVALYSLGKRLFGRSVGVTAALLLALNAFAVE